MDGSPQNAAAGRGKWLVLVAMCLSIATLSFGTTGLMAALVVMGRELGLPATRLPWLVNAYVLAGAGLVLAGARVSRDFGHDRVFLLGVAALAAGSVTAALAGGADVVLLGRVVQGVGLALIAPNAVAITKAAFPPDEQVTAVGMALGAGGLGAALGPIVGGLFTHYLSWRWLFGMNLPLLALIVALLRLRRALAGRHAREGGMDAPGIGLSACGLSALLAGLTQANRWGWASHATLGLIGVGILALALFALWERRHRCPLIDLGIFGRGVFTLCTLGYGLTFFVMCGVLYFFNLYAQNATLLGYTAAEAGLALLPFGIGIFLLPLVGKRLHGWVGYRVTAGAGFAATAVSFLLFVQFAATGTYALLWLPLALSGIGVGLLIATLPGLGVSVLEEKDAPVGGGIVSLASYLGISLATALGTTVFLARANGVVHSVVERAHVTPEAREALDHLAVGHRESVEQFLRHADPALKDVGISVIRQSSLTGFSGAMTLFLAAALLGAVVMSVSLPRRREAAEDLTAPPGPIE